MPLGQVNKCLLNSIITYFIICHNMSMDWMSLCQYNSYFCIHQFLVWHILSTSIKKTPVVCPCSNDKTNTSMGSLCSQHGVFGLSPLIARCEGTLKACPTIWFVARYFKEQSIVNIRLLEKERNFWPKKVWDKLLIFTSIPIFFQIC